MTGVRGGLYGMGGLEKLEEACEHALCKLLVLIARVPDPTCEP